MDKVEGKEMSIFQIFYVSRASDWISATDVQNILAISQRNNRRLDLTGCLLYSGRHFAQVLEGRDSSIIDSISSITSDSRHTNMRILLNHKTQIRHYPKWSMACLYNLDVDDKLEYLLNDRGPVPPSDELFELMTGIRVDTLMGGL